MSALLLALTSGMAVAVHLWFAHIHWPRNKVITAYLVVVAGFYLAMLWSYGGLWTGVRDAHDHLALVGFIGQPLLLHPALLLVAYRVTAGRAARRALEVKR